MTTRPVADAFPDDQFRRRMGLKLGSGIVSRAAGEPKTPPDGCATAFAASAGESRQGSADSSHLEVCVAPRPDIALPGEGSEMILVNSRTRHRAGVARSWRGTGVLLRAAL
jgi:hypothetical protein